MQPQRMIIKTPEILWSGGNDNGKPNPVFAIDILPLATVSGAIILCTSGTDGSTPTKGSARVWRVAPRCDIPISLLDLNDHQSAVHTARFSPCGTMLATASDRMIIVYTASSAAAWEETTEEKDLQKAWLRPHQLEIYDLRWSPDSKCIVAGSIDCKTEIMRIEGKGSIDLPGHTSYVQGVAWDPMNQFVVSQSADRSCKISQLRHMADGSIRLQTRGGVTTTKMSYAPPAAAHPDTAAALVIRSTHLYADDTVASFFRRPDFCPDGSVLVCPTGLYSPLPGSNGLSQSFCCHVYLRAQLAYPVASLVGLEDAAIAVRFSPVVYRKLNNSATDNCESTSGEQSSSDKNKSSTVGYFQEEYRYIFAVTTTSSVFVYDTQHSHPLVRITGCHLATINDAAWSVDGSVLTCCSSDGYVTIIRFEPGALGVCVDVKDIPNSIKNSHRCQYGITDDEMAACASPNKGDLKPGGGELDVDVSAESTNEKRENEATNLTPAAKDVSMESESSKKRRRINPTPLGNTGPIVIGPAFRSYSVDYTGANAAGTEPESIPLSDLLNSSKNGSDSLIKNPAGEPDSGSVMPPKKVKKRIAPVLVSNDPAP